MNKKLLFISMADAERFQAYSHRRGIATGLTLVALACVVAAWFTFPGKVPEAEAYGPSGGGTPKREPGDHPAPTIVHFDEGKPPPPAEALN